MTRIAHLSDFHLLEPAIRARRGQAWLRVNYLSLKRALDYEQRRARATAALAEARREGFDQLVITGDLTEDGALSQYEVLAEVLHASEIDPARITLVPGNHDAYGLGWDEALDGPLAPWAATSRHGAVTRLANCTVVAVSSAVPQSFVRSSGRVETGALDLVDRVARDSRRRPVVLAQHHPPFAVMHQWVHGLQNHREVTGLLHAHRAVSVLHGHTHQRRERPLELGGPGRIFSTGAVVTDARPLRLYAVADGAVHPLATGA